MNKKIVIKIWLKNREVELCSEHDEDKIIPVFFKKN